MRQEASNLESLFIPCDPEMPCKATASIGSSQTMPNPNLQAAGQPLDALPSRLSPHVIWLTGLSGAGKSTIAGGVRTALGANGVPAVILDGDDIRAGLSQGLGFSNEDRAENIRRIAHVARLLCGQGVTAIVAAVTPLRAHRALARDIVGAHFREVFVHAPLSVCEHRDVKGLYARARRGEIARFTGISDAYEPPLHPDLLIDTSTSDIPAAVHRLISWLAPDKGEVLS